MAEEEDRDQPVCSSRPVVLVAAFVPAPTLFLKEFLSSLLALEPVAAGADDAHLFLYNRDWAHDQEIRAFLKVAQVINDNSINNCVTV